jgi:flagellin FlaB
MYRRDVNQMGKITKKLKADDIGDMGIGAMIVFIAMVLVAGIAASVLIQTANRLETQAMQTGKETMTEVSTGLTVTEITGYRRSNDTNIVLMTITIQPRAGSFSIDLNQTYVEVSDSDKKVIIRYNGSVNGIFTEQEDIGGDLFDFDFYPEDGDTFGIIVLEDPRNSLSLESPVIKKGGKVMLTINVSAIFTNGLETRKDIWGLIQPEEGAAGVYAFSTPPSYPKSKNVYSLY